MEHCQECKRTANFLFKCDAVGCPVDRALDSIDRFLMANDEAEGRAHERCGACHGSGEGGAMGHCSVCNGTGIIVVTQDMAKQVLAAIERGEPVSLFTAEEMATLRAVLRLDIDKFLLANDEAEGRLKDEIIEKIRFICVKGGVKPETMGAICQAVRYAALWKTKCD